MELSPETLSTPHAPQDGIDMGEKKLIIPAEVKVCATCSYWDGERHVDPEIGVVVVSDSIEGECLAKGTNRPGLNDVRHECDCLWENLQPDLADEAALSPDKSRVGP